MLLLQVSNGQDGFLPGIVAVGGIIIVLLAIAFLVFIIFSRRQQNRLVLRQKAMEAEFERQLLQSRMEVQEHTLFQLGQELHDNVGQLLSSTKLLLGISERGLPEIPEALKTAQDTLSIAIRDLRSLTKSLNNEWLHQFNLVENLRHEVERITLARQLDIQLQANMDMLPLEPENQLIAFRVMQEPFRTVSGMREAQSITLVAEAGPDSILLRVSDNGRGFEAEVDHRQGIGLKNMKHRVHLLGGQIEWDSQPGQGTTV